MKALGTRQHILHDSMEVSHDKNEVFVSLPPAGITTEITCVIS